MPPRGCAPGSPKPTRIMKQDNCKEANAETCTTSNTPEKTGWKVALAVNACRLLLAAAFIFSGFVKAIDPLGTQYKIGDYLEALHVEQHIPSWATLAASVLLAAVEFCLGILMLFAIRRRQVSRAIVAFMAVMTAVTVWLAGWNPIQDCGCFGDAIHLTNGQTLMKNIVLLALSVAVAWRPLAMVRFISKTNQWIVIHYTIFFIFISAGLSLWYLPLFDFRPYHIGANIPKGMEIPKNAKQTKFETTFILEKDGVRKEFTLDSYPDSTWTFIDSKTVEVEKGFEPPIRDFSITDPASGEDITAKVLGHKGYTFLLIAPYLEHADDTNFGEIDHIHEYSRAHHYPFIALTASGEEGVAHWRDLTGAEYPFYNTDGTTLQTIIRSNPGLLLLRNGVVVNKWSHNGLPTMEELKEPLEKIALGQIPANDTWRRMTTIISWYVLPLLALTVADSLWQWTRWMKRRRQRKREETVAAESQ